MILVDRPIYSAKSRRWAHMVSDTSLEELHTFAVSLGIPRKGFHDPPHKNQPHYDIPLELYEQALEAGAQIVTGRELVTRMVRHADRTVARPSCHIATR